MRFEYHEPTSLQEAIALLTDKTAARPMAGGTDLLVSLKAQKATVSDVVSLVRIPGLRSIDFDELQGVLRIGALATHNEVVASEVVQNRYAALAEASLLVGSRQVRNLGTVVGNVCHASPSAETAGPLLVFDTKVKVVGPTGERVLPLDEFFQGPSKTVLAKNEIVTELLLPSPGPNTGSAYLKLSPRRAMDLAVVGVAVSVTCKEGVCESVRIALGAVAPTPMRARQAEGILIGRRVTEELMRKAGDVAAEESRPITDIRGSAGYRRDMVSVLVRRAAKAAFERASR